MGDADGSSKRSLSTWGMPAYPPGSPAIEGSEDAENGRAAFGRERGHHDFVSSSCTPGKKGTRAVRGCEPCPALRNQSSSREGSGLGGLLTSAPILTAAQASMAISSGSGAAVATTPEGAGPSHLHPQRT